MATFSDNPPAKIKFELQDTASGTKFTEEPFNISFNVFNDSVIGGSTTTESLIDDLNQCMDTVLTLTGASCIAKHLIYDITITN